jgi:hypothetical protein
MKTKIFILFSLFFITTGCTPSNTYTDEQLALEDRVDKAVNETLLDHDLESLASWGIRKNGRLNIKFAEEVKYDQYKRVVDELRADPNIPSVRAEQGGVEVCTPKTNINEVLKNSNN